MSIDLLRTQIKDLTEWWTDADGIDHDGLLAMLARHINPVQLVDSQQSVKTKITAGPAPWDDAIAHLLADVSAGARRTERQLEYALRFNLTQRGGSDGNTRVALTRLPDLVEALTPSDRLTVQDIHSMSGTLRVTVGTWHRTALLLLGAERRWAHVRNRDEDGNPIVATCPYCSSPVRIQPDLADDGDKERWACAECTALQTCDQCAHREAAARIDEWEQQHGRQAPYDVREQIWSTQRDVYGCRHVSVYGCRHALARHYYTDDAIAVCVNAGCYEEHDDGRRTRRTWPVDPFLGQLLTWRHDTGNARSA